MKKLITLLLCLILALSATACSTTPQNETNENPPAFSNDTFGNDSLGNKEVLVTEADAIAASKTLYAKMREYAGKDYEAFSNLFRNTPEETIRSEYAVNWQAWDEYEKQNFVVVCRNENLFFVNVVHYIVAGTHPDTSMKSDCWNMCISYEKGAWKFDYSENAANSLDISGAYPEGYAKAAEQGRNAVSFAEKNRMFLDESAVYEGCTYFDVKFAWQDENGNLHVAVWFANGTNKNLAYNRCKITLTNSNDELIAELDGNPDLIVKAHSSKYAIYMFPAEDVSTGTEAWGSVHASWSSYYD